MKDYRSIILEPVVSEKSVANMANNQYTFIVDKKANKIEIKKAIENIFKVHVMGVQTVNYTGKLKRVGRFMGRRSAYKKAIVRIKEGETISAFEGMQ